MSKYVTVALRIWFQGDEYLFIGDSSNPENLHEGGAIATEAAFRSGQVSYAHLFSDGVVRRYNDVIGERADITPLGIVRIEMSNDETADAIAEMIGGDSWPW